MNKVKDTMLLNTVAGEMDRFSLRAQDGLALAKQTYGMMGFSSKMDLKNMVYSTLISICPITPDDVTVNKNIWLQPTPHQRKNNEKTDNTSDVGLSCSFRGVNFGELGSGSDK